MLGGRENKSREKRYVTNEMGFNEKKRGKELSQAKGRSFATWFENQNKRTGPKARRARERCVENFGRDTVPRLYRLLLRRGNSSRGGKEGKTKKKRYSAVSRFDV